MAQLWKVSDGKLIQISQRMIATEQQLEDWLADDLAMLGLDAMLIGRQVQTDFGGRIDLLAIARNGDLVIIELKRDRTPRDVVAQVLDYASWIRTVTTPQVHDIMLKYMNKNLAEGFRAYFGSALPETVNSNHSMVIVASEFDESSSRIVEYLAEEHEIGINTAFFNFFDDHGKQYLVGNWLLDQREVEERSRNRTEAPWTGFYYVNAGHDPEVRVWDDMVAYGFIAAGYGRRYSGQLDRLSPSDPIFVYQRGHGYIGYGVVSGAATMAKNFVTKDGSKLDAIPLKQPTILHDRDDVENADYLVPVEWKKTVRLDQALWSDDLFYSRLVVCKIRHPETLRFLIDSFGAATPTPRAS